jgi:hypothetical protein
MTSLAEKTLEQYQQQIRELVVARGFDEITNYTPHIPPHKSIRTSSASFSALTDTAASFPSEKPTI